MTSLRGRAAIVGVADDVSPTGELDRNGRELEAATIQAATIQAALDDAGLALDDVDGVCHAMSAVGLAEYLGIHPRFLESTNSGGSCFEIHAEHAAAAIAAGLADVVVSADRVSIGDRVGVTWEPLSDGRQLPLFTPIE